MMQYTIKTKIRKKINGWVGRESRTRSSWRRARGEPRLIDPWRGGLVNVTQSNGSASLKCQLYADKPSRFILINKAKSALCSSVSSEVSQLDSESSASISFLHVGPSLALPYQNAVVIMPLRFKFLLATSLILNNKGLLWLHNRTQSWQYNS